MEIESVWQNLFNTIRKLALPLLIAIGCSVTLALWFPILPNVDTIPVLDINTLAPTGLDSISYFILISLFFISLWLLYSRFRRGIALTNVGLLFVIAALVCVPLVLTYPITSSDVFRYIVRGRMTGLLGYSPFHHQIDQVMDQVNVQLSGEWSDMTSPYGPVWELYAAGIARMAGGNLGNSLLLIKSAGAAFHLLSGWFIWKILDRRQARTSVKHTLLILWLFNPALMLTFVVNGHNDALMLFVLICSIYLMIRFPVISITTAVLAVLIKPVALLALPFIALGVLRSRHQVRSRWRIVLWASLSSFIVVMLALLPFALMEGDLLGIFTGIVSRLILESSESGGFSPSTLTVLYLRQFIPSFSSLWITRGPALAFVAVNLLLFIHTWRRKAALKNTATAYMAYMLQAFRFRIWYPSWPLPFYLCSKDPKTWWLTGLIVFQYTSQISVLVYGYLWKNILDRKHLYSHMIGVPLIFVVPLIAVWFSYRQHLSSNIQAVHEGVNQQ